MKKLISFLLSAGLLFTVGAAGCGKNETEKTGPFGGVDTSKLQAAADTTDDNYRTFYQIFVGSFSDSDGDGIGDLRGIINRFDYLNDGNINSGESLGVQGIWLSPVFASPTYHKYDASDYYAIDPDFGTEDDLKELADLCESRNVKLIMDIAINHTSSENQWFKNFRAARQAGAEDDEYYDFYTCVDAAGRIPGNKYNKLQGCTDAYYECNFEASMPELNFDNEAVRNETVNIAKHYMQLGIDGFRFDAVKYVYNESNAKSAAFWEWYAGELRKVNPDIYLVGECWSDSIATLEYYNAFNCFNFSTAQAEGAIAMSTKINLSTQKTADTIDNFTNTFINFYNSMKAKNADGMYIPFLSNHDMDRSAGYLFASAHSAHMAANVYLLCSGSPFIYYGEEIGMKGTRGSANTDANRRLGMLWGDNDTVADPEGATYDKSKQTNGTVAEQLAADNSLLRYYQTVIRFRLEYPEIARGDYKQVIKTSNDRVGGFVIEYNGETTYLIHNVAMQEAEVSLEGLDLTKICGFVGQGSVSLDGKTLKIGAQTSVVLK